MEIVRVLQSGVGKRFGVCVCRKRHGGGGLEVVAKTVQRRKHAPLLQEELKMLRLMKERGVPHTQRLLDSPTDGSKNLWLYTKYYEAGDLLDFVISTEGKLLPLQTLLLIFIDVAHALSVMHGLGLAHFDVKPDNIFLSHEQGRLCGTLADFEMAGNALTTKSRGTPEYCAPEILRLGKKLVDEVDGRACDVYSFAQTVLEVCDQPSVAPRLQPAMESFLMEKCCCCEAEERAPVDEMWLLLRESVGEKQATGPLTLSLPEQSVGCIFEGLSLQTKKGSP